MYERLMDKLKFLILGGFPVARIQEEKTKIEDDKLLMELADIDYDSLEESHDA